MNDVIKAIKGMLIVLVVLYVISPLDLVPGPIDDVLLVLFTLGSAKSKQNRKSLEDKDD